MAVAVDRMGREIEAERFLLGGHALRQGPGRVATGIRIGTTFDSPPPNRPPCPLVARVGGAGGVGEDGLGRGEHRRPVGVERVERAAAGEALDLAAVEQARIDPLGEILERLERAVGAPLLDQLLHRLLADALERAERVAHREASRPRPRPQIRPRWR